MSEQLTTMKLHRKRMDQLGCGKSNTMRKGDRNVGLGKFMFVCTEDESYVKEVEVTMVVKKRFHNLDMMDAYGGGYPDRKMMIDELLKIYPDLDALDTITIVWFNT